MRRRSRGFLLTECLIAMALASLLLPPLAESFSETLFAAGEMRRREEALRVAASCLEIAQARGTLPLSRNLSEDITRHLASYDIDVEIKPSASGRLCVVSVSWRGKRGSKKVTLSRQIGK